LFLLFICAGFAGAFWWILLLIIGFLDLITFNNFSLSTNYLNHTSLIGSILYIICILYALPLFLNSIKEKESYNTSSIYKKENNIRTLNSNDTKLQKHTQTTQVYERNQELKNICINRAGFQCEIDNNHKSFISSKQHNYVEAHHIIPLSFQDKFIVNLDTLENLISLCPVCHKAIHQGNREEKLKVLKQIYNIRKPFNISFDDLLKLYLYN